MFDTNKCFVNCHIGDKICIEFFFCCFNSARRVYKNPDYEINNNEAIHNNNRSNYWYCWFSLVWFGGLVVWSRHKKKLIVFVQSVSQPFIQAAADNIHTNIFHTNGEWKFPEKKKWKNRKILLCKVVIWNFFIIRCKKNDKKKDNDYCKNVFHIYWWWWYVIIIQFSLWVQLVLFCNIQL